MKADVRLEVTIQKLKTQLEQLVRVHQYNFQHPEVLALSQQLDKLITCIMSSEVYSEYR